MNDLQGKFEVLKQALLARHIERYEEVELGLIAVLARYHVALIGPPGTAKSMLCEDVCHSFGARFFEVDVMNKFTTPEELFGPLDISKLREGEYIRKIDDMLPEAEIAYLDEAFKANSAILNRLLKLMNERQFKHGSSMIDVPLISLFVASNELPEGDELGALFDRFQFRKRVDYIHEPGNFVRMLRLPQEANLPKMTLAELEEAQNEVRSVAIPDDVYSLLVDIRADLQMEGIWVSDRRFRQGLQALQATAWLSGRDVVSDDDFRVLQYMLWTVEQEIKTVTRVILSHTNPLDMKAEEIMELADEIASKLSGQLLDAKSKGVDAQVALTTQGIEWFTRCRELIAESKKLLAQAQAAGRPEAKIMQAKDRVLHVAHEVARHAVGLDEIDFQIT